VRRGVVTGTLVLIVFNATLGVGHAATDVSIAPAADGTLLVTGNGWRPGQRLVVALGAEQFPVRADSTGSFEVITGMASYQGVVAVHHPGTPAEPAFARLEGRDATPPLAVLFAESLARGGALFGLTAAALGGLWLAVRPFRARRRASRRVS
jgi:hypothetical protein